VRCDALKQPTRQNFGADSRASGRRREAAQLDQLTVSIRRARPNAHRGSVLAGARKLNKLPAQLDASTTGRGERVGIDCGQPRRAESAAGKQEPAPRDRDVSRGTARGQEDRRQRSKGKQCEWIELSEREPAGERRRQ
jgi:hypothetical protein